MNPTRTTLRAASLTVEFVGVRSSEPHDVKISSLLDCLEVVVVRGHQWAAILFGRCGGERISQRQAMIHLPTPHSLNELRVSLLENPKNLVRLCPSLLSPQRPIRTP